MYYFIIRQADQLRRNAAFFRTAQCLHNNMIVEVRTAPRDPVRLSDITRISRPSKFESYNSHKNKICSLIETLCIFPLNCFSNSFAASSYTSEGVPGSKRT